MGCIQYILAVVLYTLVKVIGPLNEGEVFEAADFKLLEDFEHMTHADAVHAKVHTQQHDDIACQCGGHYLDFITRNTRAGS